MILVTGANGNLGQQILSALRHRGLTARGGSRTPASGQAHIDFDDPQTLHVANTSVLVLISAGVAEDDQVIARHRAVLDAAVRDGVGHVIYTSLTTAGDHLAFALAHRATERLLTASGLEWTILRNGLYAELFGALLTPVAGGLKSAFGDGALAATSRRDLAEAAAIVAANPASHRGRVYDLVGRPITAGEVARHLGLIHETISLADYRKQLLADSSLLPFQPPMLLSIASSIRHGFLGNTGDDLRHLLGREPADPCPIAAHAVTTIGRAAAQ